jgi:phosphatidate phosphatase APP1
MLSKLRRALTGIALTLPIFTAGCRESGTKQIVRSNIKSDEVVVFYPTYARWDSEEKAWICEIHGKVFEPEDDSRKRAAFIRLLRSSTDALEETDANAFLDERVRPFLVDNERGKSVLVAVATQQELVGKSGPNGHFHGTIMLPSDSVGDSIDGIPETREVRAILPRGDDREFQGRVHLIAPTGVSVISDIDDTIKISKVTDKKELMRNTFLRDFRAIEGMPDLYRQLSNSGVAFHYVSGSPWQLFGPIESWMAEAGIPQGTLHLKHLRLKDSSVFDLLSSQNETKLNAIEPILRSYPDRHFILVGDTSEQDPEIYAQLARKYPDQIAAIYIRNATGEDRSDARFEEAFRELPRTRCALFDEASEISTPIMNLLSELDDTR